MMPIAGSSISYRSLCLWNPSTYDGRCRTMPAQISGLHNSCYLQPELYQTTSGSFGAAKGIPGRSRCPACHRFFSTLSNRPSAGTTAALFRSRSDQPNHRHGDRGPITETLLAPGGGARPRRYGSLHALTRCRHRPPDRSRGVAPAFRPPRSSRSRVPAERVRAPMACETTGRPKTLPGPSTPRSALCPFPVLGR